jgi:hypothetical protein
MKGLGPGEVAAIVIMNVTMTVKLKTAPGVKSEIKRGAFPKSGHIELFE